MSDAPITTDELDTLVSGAERAIDVGDNDTSGDLATRVRNDSLATPEQQGRAALVLSRAALGLGSHAAIGRHQPEQAEQLLAGIWATTRSDESQLAEASYQMGRALLLQGRVTEAKEYADWAAQAGRADAAGLQKEIAELLAATASASDGVQVAEQTKVFQAAEAAYNRGDYPTALDLYSSVYESPALLPRAKAGCSFNIAQCHRHLSNFDMARVWYEEYLRIAPDSQYAAEVSAKLDNMEELAHLTSIVPVD